MHCFRVEQGSDVHIALTGHVFPDHLRPQYAICMKPPMILCQKRNRDREGEGVKREERERAACCEATDCTLVSHNSPMSQMPPGLRRHSPNACRRKKDIKGTPRSPGDDDRNTVFVLTQRCQQRAGGRGGEGRSGEMKRAAGSRRPGADGARRF